MNRYLLGGLATIVIANMILLGHVAWNRSLPQKTLSLSERELTLPPVVTKSDNSEINLRLQVRTLNPRGSQHFYGTMMVASNDKLSAFGFRSNCGRPLSATPTRSAWFALEFNGATFDEQRRLDDDVLRKAQQRVEHVKDPQAAKAVERSAKQLAQSLERQHQYGSRLYVKDVDPKRSTLAARYGAAPNIVITHGSVTCMAGQLALVALDAGHIHVPRQFRAVVGKLPYRFTYAAPRYAATVAFGRLGEPWILDLKKL